MLQGIAGCGSVQSRVLQCAATDETTKYGVATISRVLKIIGLFCRISSV